MRKILFLLLGLALLMPFPAAAEVPSGAPTEKVARAKLTTTQKADVQRIESYLNALKSVRADFLQINDKGELRTGKIDIQRPGKMRVSYSPPSKDFIVVDGSFVHIWDDEMKTQTNVPVGDSIADLILRLPLHFGGDTTITHFARYPAKIELSVVSTKDPGQGELTLVFEDRPLQLRQWRVLDAQGRTTGVNLENVEEGVSFPGDTFVFTAPTFGAPPKGNR